MFAHLLVDEPKFDALSAPGIVLPPLSTSSFNAPSIFNSIFPFEPLSIVSTLVFPSIILSALATSVSTYNLTAACVGTLLLLFWANVPSVENSFTEAPINPPTEPNLKD